MALFTSSRLALLRQFIALDKGAPTHVLMPVDFVL